MLGGQCSLIRERRHSISGGKQRSFIWQFGPSTIWRNCVSRSSGIRYYNDHFYFSLHWSVRVRSGECRSEWRHASTYVYTSAWAQTTGSISRRVSSQTTSGYTTRSPGSATCNQGTAYSALTCASTLNTFVYGDVYSTIYIPLTIATTTVRTTITSTVRTTLTSTVTTTTTSTSVFTTTLISHRTITQTVTSTQIDTVTSIDYATITELASYPVTETATASYFSTETTTATETEIETTTETETETLQESVLYCPGSGNVTTYYTTGSAEGTLTNVVCPVSRYFWMKVSRCKGVAKHFSRGCGEWKGAELETSLNSPQICPIVFFRLFKCLCRKAGKPARSSHISHLTYAVH